MLRRASNVLLQSSKAVQGLRFFSQGRKATQEFDLLQILRSEINYGLAFKPSLKDDGSGSLGDFAIQWDSPKTKDVVLQKKCNSGEEVAISALLGNQIFEADSEFCTAKDVIMKVCIKKPGLSSILQFDCQVSSGGDDNSDFNVQNAYYIQSTSSLSPSAYRGPLFSDLDPKLQAELKKYLEARGIRESLLNFLLLYLQKKEHSMYVKWLQELESTIMQGE